jgi:hypothetical protein
MSLCNFYYSACLNFKLHCQAVLTKEASWVSVPAILMQPDDDGQQRLQHPVSVAYESSKLTSAEQNYSENVLELLAVVHTLWVFKHYLLGSGAPCPPGRGSDFDLRTDNQAIQWLKTNQHLNKMYFCWLKQLNEIDDFFFDVEHLPGSSNPEDPLMQCCFMDGLRQAASMEDPDQESQQELFSRLGRDAQCPTALAVIRAGWTANQAGGSGLVCQSSGGGQQPLC